MLRTILGQINRSTIWKRNVKVWGFTFFPPTLDRWIALQSHRLGIMGNDEILFLRSTVRTDYRVADVGANQGLYTLFLSRLVPDGHVFGFEPDPVLFASLKENVSRNCDQNVSLFNYAVASKAGSLSLMEGQLNRGDNRIVSSAQPGAVISKVRAIALDTMIPDLRLDLLKIDVQGFELEVLRGAEKLLDANRNLLVLIEFWPHGLQLAGSTPEEVLGLLKAHGFATYQLGKKASCVPFEFRPDEWMKPGRFCNLVAARDGGAVHNSRFASRS
jgi:FkbM family methyltransferase